MPKIVYEDNHVLVAVKPPNMLSQADRTGDTDILTLLKEDIKVRYNKPGRVYLGLVHRLDRPVGGLMVFARTSKAAARLSAKMQEHAMGREYLCVVTGEVKDSFTLIDYLIKDERLNRVTVCEAEVRGAQEAARHLHCPPPGHRAVFHPPGNRAKPSDSCADEPRGRAALGRQPLRHGHSRSADSPVGLQADLRASHHP